MDLIFLLITLTILGTFTIKCMKREDEIIELEDKIIADFREFRKNMKSSKNAGSVESLYGSRKHTDRAA